ncbi:MAG: methyltransferase domain-containing protein [Enterococcus sp.]|nr:methyltransferase domain-containing protein [Enterococcus sp.]MBP7086132.1 methyltransferase domain-containing protein [Enterococcus sp.]MBP7952842.1 methyltransferase domain-containing protein [Enterococcus sp.]MBP8693642.1 methyltransferase domain-containing protein [Enterococcus sp.]MBP9638381.1 methyltransferase domain-containing protein [Enterococcus sp.]
MLKKIERGTMFIQTQSDLFRCPTCHQMMHAQEKALVCLEGHRFDVSKKGTLYFLNHQIKTDYDREMFEHRRKLIVHGMYQPLLDLLQPFCQNQRILDVGCGEGSFLQQLNEQATLLPSVGFDISKEGIYLASDYGENVFWCVADLTNLPFQEDRFTTILNIFSPSNYQEFQRVLVDGGQLIKVVPRSGYLKELRAAFYPEDEKKQHYSNQAVVEKFQETFRESERQTLTYVFDIPESCQLSLLEMSPLEWGVSMEIKEKLQKKPLKRITIDLDILIGRISD